MRGSPTILAPQKSRVTRKASRDKKPRAAVIGMGHRNRVKLGAILYDGQTRFVCCADPILRGDGNLWVRLYNQDEPSLNEWFRLEDCDELAVILDEFEPSPVVF